MPAVTVQQAFELALQHHQAGRLAEAEVLYRQVLAVQPGHAEALHFLGVAAHQGGRHDFAVEMIRQAIVRDPSNAVAHSNLATVCLATGRAEEAMVQSRRAIEIRPDFADAHYNWGAALAELGRLEEARAAYRRALEIKPDHALAWNNLGNVLRQLGQCEEAIASYRAALRLDPGHADADNNLGIVLAEQGQFDEAIAAYRRALQRKPKSGATYHNLGNALNAAGQFQEAIAAYRRAIQFCPDRLETYLSLGVALGRQGQLDEAIAALRHARRGRPDYFEACYELGQVLVMNGQLEEAIASYRRAMELRPDVPQGYFSLGNALHRQRRLDDAAAAYAHALALAPNYAEASYRLAEVWRDQGRGEEAAEAVRRVHELAPDDPVIHSDLILLLQVCPALDEAAIAAERRRWNERFGVPWQRLALPHRNDPNPERRLRVGYVSPDFRDHVLGRNLLPLFREHDRAQQEIICYSGVRKPDDLTEEFRRCAAQWCDAADLSDEALADRIRQDGVDILVDLTLHAAGNRLPVFARRPAPVQVSFAGYPASTGLGAIEHRISDRYLDGNKDAGESDHLSFIDSFWCYDPCGVELMVNKLPAQETGTVTFGSLNDFCKINEPVLKLWARVLEKVKDSRLLLLTYAGSHRQRTLDVLAREGIAAHRIAFVEPRPRREYLEFYHRVDIVLDPFPYNGHTTSLDALWIGVPVVSLAGERAISRAGLSQLSNLGLPELIAQSEDDYVAIATQLAGDLPRLAELRATLRGRMEASVLMDAPRFARRIEAAYRAIWQRWCVAQGS
ncbi:MAG: tetratricopeptide repeat protein [Chthoniobacter sp.]|uniref:tetratricopeptide repeat protein n=1 Tax=Chthoniobacter sp. TaxID=2510640 RepID=UPI0032AB8071